MDSDKIKKAIEVKSGDVSVKFIGAIALWGALFFGDPDIADAIIHFLMNYNTCK